MKRFFVAVMVLGSCAQASVLPDGTLDQLFGVAGKVTTEAIGSIVDLTSIAVQNDGKYVCAGRIQSGLANQVLVRFNQDGSLDTSFGTNGVVINTALVTPIEQNVGLYPDLLLYPDGTILVASRTVASEVVISRYTSQGAIDTTFGGGTGFVLLTPIIGPNRSAGLTLLHDGTIIVNSVDLAGGRSFLIALLSNGSINQSFGVNGIVEVLYNGSNRVFAVDSVVDKNNAIVTSGYDSNAGVITPFVIRYLANGAVDTTFGTSQGITLLTGADSFGLSLVVLDDGRLLQTGSNTTTSEYFVARYSADGQLDATFGQAGIFRYQIPGSTVNVAADSVVQADGKLVIMGRAVVAGVNNFCLLRITTQGMLDSSFGSNGVVLIPVVGDAFGDAVAIDQDNKIVSVGSILQVPNRISLVSRLRVDSLQTSALSRALWQGYYNQNNH